MTRDTAETALYDDDFHTWTQRQASLLRQARYDLVDASHLAEEIESLGKSQLAALRASYRLIAMHLLKLAMQPERATASWENTINRERGNVSDLLDDNPGMLPTRAGQFARAYPQARREAAFETRIELSRFPAEAPFTLAQIEDETFWPAGFPRESAAEKGADH